MNLVQRICRAGVDPREVDVDALLEEVGEDEGDEEMKEEEDEFETFGGAMDSIMEQQQVS